MPDDAENRIYIPTDTITVLDKEVLKGIAEGTISPKGMLEAIDIKSCPEGLGFMVAAGLICGDFNQVLAVKIQLGLEVPVIVKKVCVNKETLRAYCASPDAITKEGNIKLSLIKIKDSHLKPQWWIDESDGRLYLLAYLCHINGLMENTHENEIYVSWPVDEWASIADENTSPKTESIIKSSLWVDFI